MNPKDEPSGTPPSESPEPTGSEYQSSSNHLLNVISIDDFSLRHTKCKKPVNRDDSSGSLLSNPTESSTVRDQGQIGMQLSNAESLNEPDNEDNFDSNSAVQKGFDVLLDGADKATISYACRGLINYDNRPQATYTSNPNTKESKRFRRLNKALHEWIEHEIVIPHQAARGWHKSGPTSGQTTRATTMTPAAGTESIRSAGRSKGLVYPGGDGDNKGGAFLGMLMELDERSEASTRLSRPGSLGGHHQQ